MLNNIIEYITNRKKIASLKQALNNACNASRNLQGELERVKATNVKYHSKITSSEFHNHKLSVELSNSVRDYKQANKSAKYWKGAFDVTSELARAYKSQLHNKLN